MHILSHSFYIVADSKTKTLFKQIRLCIYPFKRFFPCNIIRKLNPFKLACYHRVAFDSIAYPIRCPVYGILCLLQILSKAEELGLEILE